MNDDGPKYSAAEAINIARLWRAGKMIGGDEDSVREALLEHVEKAEVILRDYVKDFTTPGLGMLSIRSMQQWLDDSKK